MPSKSVSTKVSEPVIKENTNNVLPVNLSGGTHSNGLNVKVSDVPTDQLEPIYDIAPDTKQESFDKVKETKLETKNIHSNRIENKDVNQAQFEEYEGTLMEIKKTPLELKRKLLKLLDYEQSLEEVQNFKAPFQNLSIKSDISVDSEVKASTENNITKVDLSIEHSSNNSNITKYDNDTLSDSVIDNKLKLNSGKSNTDRLDYQYVGFSSFTPHYTATQALRFNKTVESQPLLVIRKLSSEPLADSNEGQHYIVNKNIIYYEHLTTPICIPSPHHNEYKKQIENFSESLPEFITKMLDDQIIIEFVIKRPFF